MQESYSVMSSPSNILHVTRQQRCIVSNDNYLNDAIVLDAANVHFSAESCS